MKTILRKKSKVRLRMDADALNYAVLSRIGPNKKKLRAVTEFVESLKVSGLWQKIKVLY